MSKMTKAALAERDEAIAKLREWIKPGDTVYTILDSVSTSGMSRQIRVVLIQPGENGAEPITLHPNWAVGCVLGLRHGKRNGRELDSLSMQGCGTDMGFELVYHLGRVLFPDFACIGERCPSNDHVNGKLIAAGAPHSDGGYALRQRWL